METINGCIVSFAVEYIGQEEIKGNMGFKDEQFNKYMKDTGFKKGHAWCAYFAELCYIQGYQDFDTSKLMDVAKYFSAGAVRTYRNFSKAEGWTVDKKPESLPVKIDRSLPLPDCYNGSRGIGKIPQLAILLGSEKVKYYILHQTHYLPGLYLELGTFIHGSVNLRKTVAAPGGENHGYNNCKRKNRRQNDLFPKYSHTPLYSIFLVS